MATLASGIPVWAHLLTSDSGVVEHGQLARSATSDAFTDCGSSPLIQHWQTHEMDYSSHYMIPPQAHMTSNPHLSTLQWANAPDGAHHTNLLQHCSEYQQQQQLESVHHQDQHSHLLQQQQMKSHVNHLVDAHEDSRESKRPSPSLGGQDELGNSEAFVKRPRLEQQPQPQQQQQQQAPTVPFKVRKEKLGERITALQQLVSPFGKTDTASVLLEAIGYIKFLQEQVQVLSTPYMKSNVGPSSMHHDDVSKMGWPSSKLKNDDARQDLRSRGLCLVPVSCTLQVANDNGADFWTPAIGGSCR